MPGMGNEGDDVGSLCVLEFSKCHGPPPLIFGKSSEFSWRSRFLARSISSARDVATRAESSRRARFSRTINFFCWRKRGESAGSGGPNGGWVGPQTGRAHAMGDRVWVDRVGGSTDGASACSGGPNGGWVGPQTGRAHAVVGRMVGWVGGSAGGGSAWEWAGMPGMGWGVRGTMLAPYVVVTWNGGITCNRNIVFLITGIVSPH